MITLSLKGKRAVVTGARSGMGKATALLFADSGADVAVVDLVADAELDAVDAAIKAMGRRSAALQADVSKKVDVDRIFETAVEKLGPVDILVNCAGVISTSSMVEMPEEEWDRTIDVNLKSIYLCCRVAAKMMMERHSGTIINVASEFGLRAAENRGAYCASKAGVINLTRVLALELAGYNIRVNAISPGVIKTPLSWRKWSDPQLLEQTEASIPLGRLGLPEEAAAAILFLASEAGSYITGQNLLVDGGVHA